MVSSKAPKAEQPQAKRIVGFKLPEDVIRFLRDEAYEAGCWPNRIIEDMARERKARKQAGSALSA